MDIQSLDNSPDLGDYDAIERQYDMTASRMP